MLPIGSFFGNIINRMDYSSSIPRTLVQKEYPMSESLVIFADGGCKGNHKKGDREAYCSISVRHGEKIIRIRPDWVKNFAGLDMAGPKEVLTIKLNKANTNNEAEFGAAITALGYVDELHRRNPNRPLPPIQIMMDSDLIVSAIKGDKKIKAKNLVGLLVTAGTIFNRLAGSLDLTISRIPRTDIETILGH